MVRIVLGFFLLLSVCATPCFSQEDDQGPARTFVPIGIDKDNNAQVAARGTKKMVEGYEMNAYLGVAQENPGICSSDSCKKNVTNLLDLRYAAEGRCDSCKNPTMENVCSALQKNSCDSLAGSERTLCKAFTTGGEQALKDVYNARQGESVTKSDIALAFGVYFGFKNGSASSCQRYLQGNGVPFSQRFACKIMFSGDPELTLANVENDLSLFLAARKDSDTSLCSTIKDSKIKRACLDPSVAKLDDIK